jgi:hypothetical protein
MFTANLLMHTLPFIVNVVKVLFIPSSFTIFSDYSSTSKPIRCVWVNFKRSFQPFYVVSERQREMNRKRQRAFRERNTDTTNHQRDLNRKRQKTFREQNKKRFRNTNKGIQNCKILFVTI